MAEPGRYRVGSEVKALNKVPQHHVFLLSKCFVGFTVKCLYAVTHSAGALGGAVSAQVEAALLGRHGHDRRVDQAQLHNASVVAPQAAGEMQSNP